MSNRTFLSLPADTDNFAEQKKIEKNISNRTAREPCLLKVKRSRL